MPGFDGTGPRGLGPLTGGGRGFCLPKILSTPVQPVSTPKAIPMYGRRRGGKGFRGRGRGMGRGRWFY